MAKKNQVISLKGGQVNIIENNLADYISLTDLAKLNNEANEPRFIIQNWMRNSNTIRYLYHWEQLHNPKSNRVEMNTVLEKATNNRLTMSPKKWIDLVNAIGITSKAGRNGGTYAHQDIAMNFCYWLDPIFQIYFIKEYQRLKHEEARLKGLNWDLKRELSKINYRLSTETVKRFRLPKAWLGKYLEGKVFAEEADLYNIAVFGMTAREWREANPGLKGNIRDNANELELLIISNLQAINTELLRERISIETRLGKLQAIAQYQLIILADDSGINKLMPPSDIGI